MAETVLVGCRLPNGLLLRVGDNVVRLNGVSRFYSPQPGRVSPNPIENIIYSDAFTHVDKSFWEVWLNGDAKAGLPGHKDFDPVKTGMVYALGSRNDFNAHAQEVAKEKTGLQPINPFDKANGIEPTDEMKKALKPTL